MSSEYDRSSSPPSTGAGTGYAPRSAFEVGYAPPARYPGALPPTAGPLLETARPPHVPHPRYGLLVGIAIGVAIVLVLSVLLVTGVIPIGPAATAKGPQTFAQAYALAQANASSYPGGPWKLAFAAGLAPSERESSTFNTSALGSLLSECTAHLTPFGSGPITVGAYRGSSTSGEATGWVFAFVGSGGEVLVSLDTNGTLGTLANLDCPELTLASAFLSPIPTSLSSAAAAQAAWTAGGSAFVAQNPNGTEAFVVESSVSDGLESGGGTWTVAYTGCTPVDAATGQSASELVVVLNATTDALMNETSTPVICTLTAPGPVGSVEPPPPSGGEVPIGSALDFGMPGLVRGPANGTYPPCAAGDYCYVLSVSLSENVELSEFRLALDNGEGTAFLVGSGPGGAAIVDTAGNLVADSGPIESDELFATYGWFPDATNGYTSTSPLFAGMDLWLDLGHGTDPAGQGDSLLVVGQGNLVGTLLVPLP
jgi:hypothetical protein